MQSRISVLIFLVSLVSGYAFQIKSSLSRPTRLRGISDWRDLMFDYPATGDDRRLGMEESGPPKSICILPFPYNEVLLQGETKQLRLYEQRFIDLFEDVMDNHEGVVAMGLLASSGIIQTVPLAEVEAYNRMEGFGIFVTIRVVGRAQLIDLTQQEPYIKGVCTELSDELPPNLDKPNMLADTIEHAMVSLSSLEHKLAKKKESESSSTSTAMDKKKTVQLDDKFFDDMTEEEIEAETPMDRRQRFQQAYRIAMDTDTGGYVSSSNQEDSENRSPRELTAVSWAAFMTETVPEQDVTYRIQAMDETNVFERLKIASFMLREKRDRMKEELGISPPKKKDMEEEDGDD